MSSLAAPALSGPDPDLPGGADIRPRPSGHGPFRNDPAKGIPKNAYSPFDNIGKPSLNQMLSTHSISVLVRVVPQAKPPAAKATAPGEPPPIHLTRWYRDTVTRAAVAAGGDVGVNYKPVADGESGLPQQPALLTANRQAVKVAGMDDSFSIGFS